MMQQSCSQQEKQMGAVVWRVIAVGMAGKDAEKPRVTGVEMMIWHSASTHPSIYTALLLTAETGSSNALPKDSFLSVL